MGRDREDQEKLDAELGYSVRGEREVKLREWFSLREEGERAGDFDRKVAVLRVRKWVKANPQKRRANALRYSRKPDVRDRSLKLQNKKRQQQRRSRHRDKAEVFTCELDYCRAQFCRMPCISGPRPRFCSETHGCIARDRAKRAAAGVQLRPCSRCGTKGHNRRGCPTTPTNPPRDAPKEEMP